MPDVPTTTTIVPAKNEDSSLPTETCVVCLKGAGFGHRHVLQRKSIVFGRDPECSHPLDDPAVSRHHCRIEPDGEGFRLVDLDSRNGTFLNRVRLHGVAVLKDGDLIKVGDHTFKFLRRNAVELAYHERMAQLSMVDELTGTMNRRAILETLQRALTNATREQAAVAVIALDIDRFKTINDTRGHSAGDLVLIEVVKRLHASVRATDKVGRVGGEEFLVVLPDTPRDVAVALADRLRLAIASAPIFIDDVPLTVTISLGVCERLQWIVDTGGFAELPRCIEAMLATADARLYDAKNAGRNRVSY